MRSGAVAGVIALVVAVGVGCGAAPAGSGAAASATVSEPTPAASASIRPTSTAAPPTASPVATATDAVPLGALAPGTYTADLEPAFEFTIGEGWERRDPDPALRDGYLLLLYVAGDGGELIYIDVRDGVTASERIALFEDAALTILVERRGATMGGLAAIAIDAGRPTSQTVIRGVVGEYVINPADVIRATAVEAGGRTMLFIIESNEDDFAAFAPIAEAVLATVRFR